VTAACPTTAVAEQMVIAIDNRGHTMTRHLGTMVECMMKGGTIANTLVSSEANCTLLMKGRSPPHEPNWRDNDYERGRSSNTGGTDYLSAPKGRYERSSRRSRSRSRQRSPPRHEGRPSRDVIMEGFPVDITEEDVGLSNLQEAS
jgi:hypothetical protein